MLLYVSWSNANDIGVATKIAQYCFENFMTLHSVGNAIIPTDSYFSEG